MRKGGGWNWLRIVFIVGFCTSGVEPLGSVTREVVTGYKFCIFTLFLFFNEFIK
jgi:hypothetical protein